MYTFHYFKIISKLTVISVTVSHVHSIFNHLTFNTNVTFPSNLFKFLAIRQILLISKHLNIRDNQKRYPA